MIEISVVSGLVFSLIFSVVSFAVGCNDVRDSVLRLHILANSDSDEDQTVKLVVRDELLKSGADIFEGNVSVENAKTYLSANESYLVAYINSILNENGFDYNSTVCLTEEYFETRSYENFTLPAGKYTALKVILGKGEGHNWWCVMFPPLCLPAATENTDINVILGENGSTIVKSSSEYEIRFKLIEIIERIKLKYSV